MLALPSLTKYVRWFDELGIDGQSSDEDDYDSTSRDKQFEVLSSNWRNPDLIPFLEKLDACHLIGNRMPEDNEFGVRFTPGAPPRVRVRHGRMSQSSKFKNGLPYNFYRAEWLEKQEPGWRKGSQGIVNEIICPVRTRVDWIFPKELEE